jgi:hypothetical protein
MMLIIPLSSLLLRTFSHITPGNALRRLEAHAPPNGQTTVVADEIGFAIERERPITFAASESIGASYLDFIQLNPCPARELSAPRQGIVRH